MFLNLKNTTIGFQTHLIKEIETTLDLGDVCLLIGNNGAGKTTLIKSILGQIPLLSGDIFLDGKNLKSLNSDSIAKKISVVFSKSEIPNQYTVFDLVAFGKFIHYPYYFKLNKEDKIEIDQIISNLQLEEFRDTYLHQLSDGNLQKAFIGRALAQNSPIVILDEPTTHLDEENKIMILKLLRNLAKKHNKLILFSSHDWRLAKEFSDKIWFVKNGALKNGIAEDVILENSELSAAQLFNIHPNFVPPKIFAPDLQKELLYSFLQKNLQIDLSNYHFLYINKEWKITTKNKEFFVDKFEDILNILTNI